MPGEPQEKLEYALRYFEVSPPYFYDRSEAAEPWYVHEFREMANDFPHPPQTPDLTFYDFALFPKIKLKLNGPRLTL